MTLKFVTRYTYKPIKGIENSEESKTFQECKDACDINILYKRYLSKGFEPPNVVRLEQRYADMSKVKTYEELMNVQEDVKQLFDSLPSDIREGCNYDVDTFLEVIGQPQDDKEIKEFQDAIFDKLGMIDRKETFQDIQNSVEEGKLPDVSPSEPQKEVTQEK